MAYSIHWTSALIEPFGGGEHHSIHVLKYLDFVQFLSIQIHKTIKCHQWDDFRLWSYGDHVQTCNQWKHVELQCKILVSCFSVVALHSHCLLSRATCPWIRSNCLFLSTPVCILSSKYYFLANKSHISSWTLNLQKIARYTHLCITLALQIHPSFYPTYFPPEPAHSLLPAEAFELSLIKTSLISNISLFLTTLSLRSPQKIK